MVGTVLPRQGEFTPVASCGALRPSIGVLTGAKNDASSVNAASGL